MSGVDIDLGNKCSKNAYEISKTTFANRKGMPGEPVMSVDGLFSNSLNFNGSQIGISSDGIGTKIELAERTKIYNTLGYDLLAMVVDDLIAGGFVPTNISNIIDVNHLDYDTIDQLMSGLKKACDQSAVAISGGEIAELGGRISGYGDGMHFNWCSTAIGVLHSSLSGPLDGSTVAAGDTLICLASRGFRSNGFSLVRKTLEKKYGNEWHTEKFGDSTYGEALLTPSLVYAPGITALWDEGVDVHGVVHVTGGGIGDNLSRILKKKKLGAAFDSLPPVHDIMTDVMALAEVDNEFAYRYWNMGCGMIVAVNSSEADKALAALEGKGYSASACGSVTDSGKIVLSPIGVSYDVE